MPAAGAETRGGNQKGMVSPVLELAATRRLSSQLVDDLISGLSVLLTGLPGSGRSHLVQLVAEGLRRRGANVVLLRGNQILADRPLAVLSLVESKAGKEKTTPDGPPIARAAESLWSLVRRPKSVLLIDDTAELDPVTAGIIADARAKEKVPLLLVGDYRFRQNKVLAKLVSVAQPGVAIAIAGLSFESISQMANAQLDGVVGADVISKIATLSGGLPGLVSAILQLGCRSGRLTRRNRIWHADGDLWDDGLEFSLLQFTSELDQEDLDCLTRLAHADGISRSEADDLVGNGCVRRLVQHGLLRITKTATSTLVQVFPGALGELLRRRDASSGRIRERDRALVAELGRWPGDLTGSEAAAVADRIRADWRTAVAQRWARWNGERTAGTAVPLLRALLAGAADDERIPVVLERTEPGIDDPAFGDFLLLEALYRAAWKHDLPGALAMLDQSRRMFPQLDALLRGQQGRLLYLFDRMPDPKLLRLPDEPDSPGRVLLLQVQIEALVIQGRVWDAAKQLAVFDARDDHEEMVKGALEAIMLVYGDDVRGGVELAINRLWNSVAASDPESISGYAFSAVVGLLILGRFHELESIVEIVFRLGITNAFQNHFQAGVFMAGSYLANWEGRRDYASTLLEQSRALGADILPYPGMHALQDALSAPAPTVAQLWNAVDDLLGRGYLVFAVHLAVLTVELDWHPSSPELAEPLISAGTACQSKLLRAWTCYVRAVVRQELSLFPQIVDNMRDASGPVNATRARVTWALLLRERGDMAGWLDQANAAWSESTNMSHGCAGMFTRLIEAVDLTDREADVARLAVQNYSTREIADGLCIVPRTVEAHLYSVYRKTGVSSREELGQIAQTWFTLSPDFQDG